MEKVKIKKNKNVKESTKTNEMWEKLKKPIRVDDLIDGENQITSKDWGDVITGSNIWR